MCRSLRKEMILCIVGPSEYSAVQQQVIIGQYGARVSFTHKDEYVQFAWPPSPLLFNAQ